MGLFLRLALDKIHPGKKSTFLIINFSNKNATRRENKERLELGESQPWTLTQSESKTAITRSVLLSSIVLLLNIMGHNMVS